MKLRGTVKEDLYYIEEEVSAHIRELMTKKKLDKVVPKYAIGRTKGVYDTEEELFTTDDGVQLCIPEEYLTLEGAEK